ncbi:hypothetical protein LLG46_13520 [bacterium]|nr:hypothetical protein [bacterium]
MRLFGYWAVLVCVLLPVCAYSQTDDIDSTTTSSDITVPAPITPPNQVAPIPVAPSQPPSGYIPMPEPSASTGPANFISVFGAEWNTIFEDGKPALTVASGHVTARYRNVLVTADAGTVDYKTNTATFCGNVVFQIDKQQVLGKQIIINLNTGKWDMQDAITTLTPDFTRGYTCAPVFGNAPTIEGIKRSSMAVRKGEVTTCDLADPHYQLVARSVDIYPGQRLVLRNVKLIALHKRLLTFRRLVIPINRIMRDPELLPKIGQTTEEGFYTKFSYPLSGSGKEATLLLVDLMSKKGVGTGISNNYQSGSTNGDVQFYTLNDRNIGRQTYTGRVNHNQCLGDYKLNLMTDFRANEYQYAPHSQTLTGRATLLRDTSMSKSSLVIGYQSNNTYTKTSSTTGNLTYSQKIGTNSSLDSLFNYIAYSGSTNNARLTSNLAFTKKEEKFDWSLTAIKQTDLSDEAFVTSGSFGGVEKLPELSLTTDSARIGNLLPFGIPTQMKLAFGEYAEVGNTSLFRTYYEMATPAKPHPISSTWNLLMGAGLKQYVYSNDTAQYALNASTQLKKKFTECSDFSLTYRYQNPRGYTPFRSDYISTYNIINAALTLKQGENNKFSLIGGYNFEQPSVPWQNTTLRWSIQTSPHLLFYTATGFNFNTWKWKALINQVRYRSLDDCFRFDLGTRYDTTVGVRKLSSIKGLLDTRVGPKTRVQASLGYNGISQDFDYQNIMITRDLHCWELSLAYVNQTGFYTDKGIRLNLRIKAFPLTQNFGAGAFGQVLDTSVGEDF